MKVAKAVATDTGNPGARRSEVSRAPLEALLDLYGMSAQRPGAAEICRVLEIADDCLAFGVTELSLAFSTGDPPAVRCLAEVVDACRPDEPRVREAFEVARRLDAVLTRYGGTPSVIDRFAPLFQAVYLPIGTLEHLPNFRFGLAVEWRPAKPPSFKAYFDLFAAGREEASARLAQTLEILGLTQRAQLLTDQFKAASDHPVCRGIGADFAPGMPANLRLYYGGRTFTTHTLHDALDRIRRGDCHETLDRFCRLVLGSLSPDRRLESTLVSPVLSAILPPNQPILKLDAVLSEFMPDDQAASQAIGALGAALSLDLPSFGDALSAVANGRLLCDTRSVLQYCSIDFISADVQKVGVYFRPFGLETPHMSVGVRPTIKPGPLGKVDRSIRGAIQFLEHQRVDHYAGAAHRMIFPRLAGFSGVHERHEGRVFLLALVGNGLFDAAAGGFRIDWGGLDSDLDALVDMRCRDIPGAWRYFPTLAELPPDVDDLAEIYRFVGRVRPGQAAALCGAGIRLVLEQASPTDGSFETWIINRNQPCRMYEASIARYWGCGPDDEVIANLLDALVDNSERERYTGSIQLGTRYILGRQSVEGSWPATWYWGDYYGTFACARLVAHAWPGHPALGRVAKFLTESMNADGGWGVPESTPTDTALAMLTCTSLRSSLLVGRDLLKQGASWLLNRQAAEGSWIGTPLIRMDMNRALTQAGHGNPHFVSYGNSTLATTFCARALCAARSALAKDLSR